MLFYLDAETAPAIAPDVLEEIAANVKPPRTLKKAETIAAWERDERPAIIEERLAATALDGTYGRVFAVAWAPDDAQPKSYIGPEVDVLRALFGAITDAGRAVYPRGADHTTFVGHNVLDFDLRFIWQRAVVNGIRPPEVFTGAVHAKPWAGRIADTMTLWNPSRERRISLANLCRALGVASPKQDLSGSTVYAAYVAGELGRVANYVEGDVVAVRECYTRMMMLGSAQAATA